MNMNWSSFKNPYGVLVVVLSLVAVGLVAFSVQGAFVGLLLLGFAAGLRLLYTSRQTARDQLAVSREIASWLSSIHHANNHALNGRALGVSDPNKPRA
ncbi:MAG: hypothetical protein HC933_00415 [Pleurocapsa sp. SU_196_0]|nr:hypothetical protein [Pleurocapsa sp. SU_196_0]